MRIMSLLAILALGACEQQSTVQTANPPPLQPQANPSVAVLPVPPSSIPNGQQQYFCTAAVGLC